MHTITERRVKRLNKFRKIGNAKQQLRNDPEAVVHKKGDRHAYAGVLYQEGSDRVSVLHATKGWRNYNIDNLLVGI